jgi:hypothetical protein
MIIGDIDISPPEKPLPKIKKDDFLTKVFAYLESITVTKKYIMITDEDEKNYRECRFMIQRALSFSRDLVETVNLINGMHDMLPRTEYEFFLNFVPVKERRPKWHKKSPKSVFMNSVREYYGYSETKAEEAMKLLTVEQMSMIEKRIRKEDDAWTFLEGGALK